MQRMDSSPSGSFSVNEEETKYILYQAFPGAECDTKNRADMLSAVRELALLHQSAQNYEGSVPEFLKSGQNNLLLLYEKRNRELNKVRNYIRAKKNKNDFEMMLSGFGNTLLNMPSIATMSSAMITSGEHLDRLKRLM